MTRREPSGEEWGDRRGRGAGQVDLSLVSVDPTVARAHQDAAGPVVDPAVLQALELAWRADRQGSPGIGWALSAAGVRAHAGQAADSPRFVAVLEQVKARGPIGRPRTRPDAVAAEAGQRRRPAGVLRRRAVPDRDTAERGIAT